MPRSLRLLALLVATAGLLGGCATSYTLDNQVQAFASTSALAQPAAYRFERLPSQTADPAQQLLETWADPALHKAGLRRDDAAPKYSVQVAARVQRALSPWDDPWDWGWGVGWGGRRWGWGFHHRFPPVEHPWFLREVNVVVRDLGSNKVVFESRAVNTGPWRENQAVLPAMFEAALQGFPNPPTGPRRVDITVPVAGDARG